MGGIEDVKKYLEALKTNRRQTVWHSLLYVSWRALAVVGVVWIGVLVTGWLAGPGSVLWVECAARKPKVVDIRYIGPGIRDTGVRVWLVLWCEKRTGSKLRDAYVQPLEPATGVDLGHSMPVLDADGGPLEFPLPINDNDKEMTEVCVQFPLEPRLASEYAARVEFIAVNPKNSISLKVRVSREGEGYFIELIFEDQRPPLGFHVSHSFEDVFMDL